METLVTNPKTGSCWYYALYHTHPLYWEVMRHLYSFYQTILKAAQTDPTVAQAKLTWWGTEIENIGLQKIHHPLTHQLESIVEKYRLDLSILSNFIEAIKQTLEPFYFENESDLLRHSQDVSGLCQWIAKIQDNNINPEFAHNAGIAIALIEQIRWMGKHVNAQKITLPHSTLARFEIDLASLLNAQNSEIWHAILLNQAQLARTHFDKALATIEKSQRKKQTNLLIVLKIKLQLLDEIERARFDLARKTYYLTPLRKWWIAQTVAQFKKINRNKNDSVCLA